MDGSDHDFSKDPIRMVQDGPWLTARETTLGADNGIAIAIALALVDSPEVTPSSPGAFFYGGGGDRPDRRPEDGPIIAVGKNPHQPGFRG